MEDPAEGPGEELEGLLDENKLVGVVCEGSPEIGDSTGRLVAEDSIVPLIAADIGPVGMLMVDDPETPPPVEIP